MLLLLLLSLWFGQGQQRPAESQTPAKTQQQAAQNEPSAIPQENAWQSGNKRQQGEGNAAHWSDPLILLQLLLFFAVAVQAGIYVWQALLMRRSLRVLEGQGKTFEDQAVTMSSQRKAMQEQADTMKIQSEAAMIAAKAAERSAHIASEGFRPHVYFKETTIEPLVVEQEPRIRFVLSNSGSSARNLEINFNWGVRPRDFSGVLPWIAPSAELAGANPEPISLANGEQTTFRTPLLVTFNQPELDGIMSGAMLFMIHGVVTYQDTLGRAYTIPFCRCFNRDTLRDLANCPRRIRTTHQEEQENPN